MTDIIGNEITPGALVAYPGRRGSSLWMNRGRVVEVRQIDKWGRTRHICKVRRQALNEWERDGLLVTVGLDNIVVVREPQATA